MLVEQVNTITNLILVSLFFLAVIVGGIAYYFIKVRKVATTEEHIDYSTFRRIDATEYCKFKDIISTDEDDVSAMGMIDMGNHVYVAGIDVQGYNYYAASAADRERTMINAIALFNIVETPIQLRQTVQAIDITRNIEKEKEFAKDIEKRLIMLQDEYRILADSLEENIDNVDIYESIEKRLKKLGRSILSFKWQLSESKEMIHYMGKVSGEGNGNESRNMKKVNQILFSYTYKEHEDIEALSEEQICLKAERELKSLAQIYGSALENCGCSWHELTADDLIDLMRRHYHPETSDNMRLDELLNSSYSALYVDTKSLEELERQRRSDEEYEEEMRRFAEEQRQALEAAKLKEEAIKAEMWREAAAVGE